MMATTSEPQHLSQHQPTTAKHYIPPLHAIAPIYGSPGKRIQLRPQPHNGMPILRACAVALWAAEFTTAIPRVTHLRRLKGSAHEVEDVATGRHDAFSPNAMPTAPDGMPECEVYGGPNPGQENQLDSWVYPGRCDELIASGLSCEHHFCPECNRNEDCNKACGYCESTTDEPVDCNTTMDPDCSGADDTCRDDESARKAADPFKNELSPFTQGCAQIADNGFCEVESYIELGVQSFCCKSCSLVVEKDTMEGVCDFMAVVNGCQDQSAVAAMHGTIDQVCNNACSVAVMDNWEVCIADPSSDFAHFQDTLEPIVTGCRAYNNGEHDGVDAPVADGSGR